MTHFGTKITVSSMLDKAFEPKKRIVEDNNDTDKKGDAEALAAADISVDDIVGKLNSIRSGKSFDNDVVSKAMAAWVKGLDDAEKTALFSFLKGIAQIVTGEVPAQMASEPSDAPADVEMSKTSNPLKVHVKPNLKKAPSNVSVAPGAPHQRKAGVEDTSGPVPIKARARD